MNLLPSEASCHRKRGTIGVFQVTADAATKRRLQRNALLGALQEVRKPAVVPVVPAQQAQSRSWMSLRVEVEAPLLAAKLEV